MKQNIVRLLAVGLILGVVLGTIIQMANTINPQPEPLTKVSAKLQISEISATSLIDNRIPICCIPPCCWPGPDPIDELNQGTLIRYANGIVTKNSDTDVS